MQNKKERKLLTNHLPSLILYVLVDEFNKKKEVSMGFMKERIEDLKEIALQKIMNALDAVVEDGVKELVEDNLIHEKECNVVSNYIESVVEYLKDVDTADIEF
jgi:hypothetical protein